jgi:hypothetical protein
VCGGTTPCLNTDKKGFIMNVQEIRNAIRRGLIILGIYILISLVTGAVFVARDWAPFGAGFALTAVWMVVVWWLIRQID